MTFVSDENHLTADLSGVVDTSLVDAMLDLSPEERLRQNDRMLHMIEELRRGTAVDRSHYADR